MCLTVAAIEVFLKLSNSSAQFLKIFEKFFKRATISFLLIIKILYLALEHSDGSMNREL